MFARFLRHFHGEAGIKELLWISLPIIVSQASSSMMLFTDRYLLTPLGRAYPTASMAAGFLSTLLMIFFIGTLTYITPLVAQYLGAKQTDKCPKVLAQGIYLILFVYPLIVVGGYYLAPLYYKIANIAPEEAELALDYFEVINAGSLFTLLAIAFSSFFSGIGNTKYIMVANLSGMLANIPLAYFFIYQDYIPYLSGVRGAAFGTVLSSLFMCILFIIFLRLKQVRESFDFSHAFSFDREIIAKLFKFGGPSGAEFFLIFFAFSSFVTLFHSYGVNEALAMTITFNWDIVAFFPIWGLSIGIMSMVGKYLGAKKVDLALRSTFSGAKIAFTLTCFYMFCFLYFSVPMVKIFIPKNIGEHHDFVLNLGSDMLRMVSIYCWANALNLVFSATLRAAGDTRICMWISICGDWTMLLTTFLAIRVWKLEPLVTWYIFVGFVFFVSLLFVLRFRQGRWKNIQVV